MAKDTKGNTGTVPTLSTPARGTSDFDKFVAQNMDKAMIGTAGEGDTVNPIGGQPSTVAVSSSVELPAGLSPEQRGQIEAVIAARAAQQQAVHHAVAQPPTQYNNQMPQPQQQQPAQIPVQPFSTDRGTPRAWNPMDRLMPTTPVSVLEKAMEANQQLPGAVSSGMGSTLTEIKPLEGTPQVYVEAYNLLRALLAGNWIIPGGRSGEVNALLPRLKLEIEHAPNSKLATTSTTDTKS